MPFRPSGIKVSIRQDLESGSGRSGTTLVVDPIITKDGRRIVMTDIGDICYAKIDQGTSNEEIFSFTGITDNTSTYTLTGCVWGYNFYDDTSAVEDNQKKHVAGASMIITNDDHFLAKQYVNVDSAQTISGKKTFSTVPASSAAPVDDNDLGNKSYIDAAVAGSFPSNRIVVSGNAGATVAAGQLLYLDTADTEWKLCDADTATTVENVMLGIAQGAGTDGAAISGGVLIKGYDNHQTGLTTNSVYYAGNTAGEIVATPGTVEVTIGTALSATELYFYPRFNQQLTEDQQDALAGTSGTPSASNKYVTADDVSDAAASGKIVRATGTALPALSGENLTNIARAKYYGDGAQGALTATGATTINSVKTNIDAESAAAQAVLNVADTTGIVAGDHVFIHQTRGTGAGLWEIKKVLSVQAGDTLTLTENLANTYQATGAQVILIPEYTLATFKTGASLSDTEWAGTTGGIVVLYASQGVIIENGVTLSVAGFGFRGGVGENSNTNTTSFAGEGTAGASVRQYTRNGNGGGGGNTTAGSSAAAGGGGHIADGTVGNSGNNPGQGGYNFVDALSSHVTGDGNIILIFGGAGGGNLVSLDGNKRNGGDGGGIIILIAPLILIAGAISANGGNGASAEGGSGNGAGGTIGLFSDQIYGVSNCTVAAGSGGTAASAGIILQGYPAILPIS